MTLAGPAAASAAQGFGYNDPRSVAGLDFNIRDVVRCGRGRDSALVDRADGVARRCERVKVA